MSLPPTTLHICLTCRRDGDDAEAPRAGARLHAAVVDMLGGQADIVLASVDCLSVCKRPVTVAFSAPGKWTYVAADADDAAEVIGAAGLYGEAPDGRVPWRQRPTLLKSGLVARIPPTVRPPETPR